MRIMRLDWFEDAFQDETEAISLGKSVEIPADPNSPFFAGVIYVIEVPTNERSSINAQVSINTEQADTAKGKPLTMRMLNQNIELPLDFDLTLSWQFDTRKTSTYHYHLQVKSFKEVEFTLRDC
jgi:hypothetical protein